MSDLNTAPSEQPAPTQTPVETPGAQPQSENHSEAIGTLDQSTLGSVLWGEKKEPSEQAAASPTPPANPEPGAQPTEGTQTAEAKDNESSLRRLALGGVPMSERQQMAEVTRMIREGEATSQVDALRKMGVLDAAPLPTENPASPQSAESPEPPVTATETPDPVADIETTIADLREQRKVAKADYDTDEEERLTNLIEDHMVTLAEARAEARIAAASHQTQAKTYQQEYVGTVDAMEERFPWATDENDPRYQALDDKVTAARARNDATLQDPKFIMSFAETVDQMFGNPQPPARPPAPPPIPQRVVGGGVAPGHSEAYVPTEVEAKQLINTASKEQLAAALFR
jgi:hypothetical protein